MDAASPAKAATRFIGRSDELASLVVALDHALAGTTTVVLVGGEAGIGKTRLLEELARLADLRLVPVAWGRASTIEGAPPFWPWRQVLRARSIDRASLGGDEGEGTSEGGLAPEDRFVLFERVGDLLTADARDGGLVVLLDDLHWADLASLHLLRHLAEHRRDARLLVACSVRTLHAAGASGTAADDVVAAIERVSTTRRLDLRGFGVGDIHAQLADVLGHAPAVALVQQLAVQTNGNPLFVREMGRVVRAGDPTIDHVVPDAVRSVIRQRLHLLPEATRQTLAAASVLGSDLDPAAIAVIIERPIEAVMDQLAEAEAVGIVVPARSGSHPRFSHDLMREALQDELAASELARLHLRIAEHLGSGGGDHLAEIAHHRLAALPLGDPAVAVAGAVAAAHAAMDQLAFEDAARLYERALAVRSGDGLDSPVRMGVLLDAARALHFSHDLEGAMRACRESAALARRAGDAAGLARAALLLHDVTEAPWIAEIEPWIAEALASLDAGDSSLRAQLVAMDALIRVLRERGGGEERSMEALAMAERLDDVPALLAAYRARQLVLSGPDRTSERVRHADRMIDLGRDRGILDAIVWGHLWRFDALVQLGRIADAEAELDELDVLANRLGRPHIHWHVNRGRVAIWAGQGRFAEARELGEQTGFVPTLAVISRYTGAALPSALEEAMFAIADSPFAPLQRLGVASYAMATGRREEAVALYARVGPPGRSGLPRFLLLGAYAYHVVVAMALDDRAAVAACYDLLLPFRHLHVAGGAGVVLTVGSVETFLGEAALYLGRREAAIEHLRVGRAANDAAGLAPLAVEASYHLALALLEGGSGEAIAEASELLLEARATAARLGMAPLAEQIADALDAASRSDRTAPATDPLSKREREIAALVAEGLTNRQIADTAHISERTAENHVQHILTKLGFQNRSQIAVWFTQQQR